MSIDLVRVDFRTVHAQVMHNWTKQLNIRRIILIDDELFKDDFLQMIYRSSAPRDTKLEFISAKDATVKLREHYYEKLDERCLILFKLISQLYAVVKDGYLFKDVQIGGAPAGPGRKNIYNSVSITQEEHDQLVEISEMGCRIYFQTVPGYKPEEFENIIRKFSNK